MESAFVLVAAPKAVEMGTDHKLHRATQAKLLQEELAGVLESVQVLATANDCALKFVEGAAVAAIGSSDVVSIADTEDRVVVFQGNLKNLSQLAARFCPDGHHNPHVVRHLASPRTSSPGSSHGDHAHADQSHSPGSNTSPARPAATAGPTETQKQTELTPAEVVLAMYEAEGMALLTRLQGRFSFVMYDCKQMRVLAARDGSGEIPLLQARTSRDGLIIATSGPMLACCHDTLEFQPGFFKYGWHAEPRLFTAKDAAVAPVLASQRRSIDAQHHHSNGAHHSDQQRRRLSTDAQHTSRGGSHSGSRPNSGRDHGSGSVGAASSLPVKMKRMSLDHSSLSAVAGSPSNAVGSPQNVARSAGHRQHQHHHQHRGSARKDQHPPAVKQTGFTSPAPAPAPWHTKASGKAASNGVPRAHSSNGSTAGNSSGSDAHSLAALNPNAHEFVPGGAGVTA